MERWLQQVDHQVRRRRPGAFEREDQGQAAAGGGGGGGRGGRGQPGLLHFEVLPAPALPAGRPDRVVAAGLQAAVGEGRGLGSTPSSAWLGAMAGSTYRRARRQRVSVSIKQFPSSNRTMVRGVEKWLLTCSSRSTTSRASPKTRPTRKRSTSSPGPGA